MLMTRPEAEKLLKNKFGIERFYPRQWETIEKLLKGEKVLLIEKTGFGKSLCYQFTATMLEGVTVIFSPLIALMRDQVKKLNLLGIAARCINSGQTAEENRQIIEDAKAGKLKILYIAPERQENDEWIEAARHMKLSMVVIDEAHCISVWGHDFRPAFRRILSLVKLLPKTLPVLAATATATKRVETDIAAQIGGNVSVIRGGLLRENLRLFVIKVNSEDEKLIWLGKNLGRVPGSGILYTGTRINTEIYDRWLSHNGYATIRYNAGVQSSERVEIENGLMNNRWKCVISTNALGMGIDKPDIRFIIHTQIPQSPVHYYQEIGRAGRDGEPSNIILFYSPEDRQLPESFIESSRPPVSRYEKVIEEVKKELIGERELIKRCNIKQNQFRVVKSDLIEQGIIREISAGRTKFEYIPGAPKLNTGTFEKLRELRLNELDKMTGYIDITSSRMKFLCDYLGDDTFHKYDNCDNSGLKKITVNVTPDWEEKLRSFREDDFPLLEVELKNSNMVNGYAASYYGVSNTGKLLYQSKYENAGDFPENLVQLTVKAFNAAAKREKFDLILYIPPTASGDLVKNFAEKISKFTKIPISGGLTRIRKTEEQKVFQNGYSKSANVKNAFGYKNPEEIKGKSILLIDDLFDSGATIKEAGRFLTKTGAKRIMPLVIAKTTGGGLG
jgi:ATP-dependent DNA helicase RecQ